MKLRPTAVLLPLAAAAALVPVAASAQPQAHASAARHRCSGRYSLHEGNITITASQLVSYPGDATTAVSCKTAWTVVRHHQDYRWTHEVDCRESYQCKYTISGRRWSCYGDDTGRHGECDAARGYQLRWVETDRDVG